MGSASLPGLFGAFFAGLLSFLSPCVLPLIPVYLSFISGESLTEIREGGSGRMRLFFRSISFVLGFTVVFVLLAILFGTGARFIGSSAPRVIMRIAGAVVIILGLNMLFDFIPFLRGEIKAQAPNSAASFFKGISLRDVICRGMESLYRADFIVHSSVCRPVGECCKSSLSAWCIFARTRYSVFVGRSVF